MSKVFWITITALIGVGLWSVMEPIKPKTSANLAAEQGTKAKSDVRYDAEWAAIEACRAAALSQTHYPSKADFHPAVHALSDDSVNWSIVGTVDLMNGFGAMIPHRYACVVQGSSIVSDTLQPKR